MQDFYRPDVLPKRQPEVSKHHVQISHYLINCQYIKNISCLLQQQDHHHAIAAVI